jgi:hypothetical protein
MINGGGAAGLIVACVFALGCQPPLPQAETSSVMVPAEIPVDRQTCEEDAVSLTMPVEVRAGPVADSETLLHLRAGAFLYLCEKRGGYRAVMFPGPDERVDCWQRSTTLSCRAGWVREPISIEIYG